VTEQLLAQQLESPSGTGRVEPRSDYQPDSPHQQATGYQQADPILTGRSVCAAWCVGRQQMTPVSTTGVVPRPRRELHR